MSKKTTIEIPPIEQCELFYVPTRRSPQMVFADPYETIEQAMVHALKMVGCNFNDVRFMLGEEKRRAYEFIVANPQDVEWRYGSDR